MRNHSKLFLILAALACSDSTAPVSTPLRLSASDLNAPFQTDSRAYTLRAEDDGWWLVIGYEFSNPLAEPVYFINCNGQVSKSLEKLYGTRWKVVWSNVMPACASQPIMITPAASIPGAVGIFAGFPGSNSFPQFEVATIPGTYRLVWRGLVRKYDDETSSGEPLELDKSVSNRFTIALPQPQ